MIGVVLKMMLKRESRDTIGKGMAEVAGCENQLRSIVTVWRWGRDLPLDS